MGQSVSSATGAGERGWSPFAIFGVALVVAVAWGLYDGLAYLHTPTFVEAALPTIAGAAVAVVAVIAIALTAPPNE